MNKQTRFSLGLAILISCSGSFAAEATYPVVSQNGFSAEANLSSCSSSCSRQMAVTARYEILFNGNFTDLLASLESLGLRISIYDGQWSDSDEGEVVMKVSSTIHQRQRWRRANLRRKLETPNQMASAIYATVPVGTTVTLEFLQAPAPLTGNDFTINVRRYQGDTLLNTGSRAIAPNDNDNVQYTEQ